MSPRIFSRGSPWTAQKLISLLQYIDTEETETFRDQMRLFFCPERALEETIIIDPLLEILDFINKFTFHLNDFHPDQPHLVSLWNGAIGEQLEAHISRIERAFVESQV